MHFLLDNQLTCVTHSNRSMCWRVTGNSYCSVTVLTCAINSERVSHTLHFSPSLLAGTMK